MLRQMAIGIGLLGLAGVGMAQPLGDKTDVDEVRLAVFRQQVAFWLDEHARGSKTVVCLAIEDGGVRRSVTKDYLKRFPGEPAVRSGDDCDERASGLWSEAPGAQQCCRCRRCRGSHQTSLGHHSALSQRNHLRRADTARRPGETGWYALARSSRTRPIKAHKTMLATHQH